MKYSKDMLLDSDSGYFFPFTIDEGEDVNVILDYGEQLHPMTGEKFFHKGIDFTAKGKDLYALASGTVTGVGESPVHKNIIVVRYGNFFVTYGHIAQAVASYGQQVRAGDVIAKSGDFLHLGVKFEGEEIDPNEFLDLLNSNMDELISIGKDPVDFTNSHPKATTSYDDEQKKIEPMMFRFMPAYIQDLQNGNYKPTKEFEEKMRNLLSSTSSQNYFYEKMPTVSNPLGLTDRAAPLASKATDLLITDFLHYVATKHNVFPPGWTTEQKKKLFRKAMDFKAV